MSAAHRFHTLVLAGVLSLTSPQTPEAGQDPPEMLRRDWLTADIRNARLLRRSVPGLGAGSELEPFLKALGDVDERNNDDIGCGARRLFLAKYGGYTSAWITMIVDDTGPSPVIAALHVSQSGPLDEWPLLVDELAPAWDGLATRGEHSLDHAYEDADALERLTLARQKALGAPAQRDVPEELAGSFAVLTDAMHMYDVGEVCYDGGFEPLGRTAIDELVAAERWDLVRRALRGANPEGRVYAALALREAERVDARDAAVIERLRSWDDVPVSTCNGCFVSLRRASDLL